MKKIIVVIFLAVIITPLTQSCTNSEAFSGRNSSEPELVSNDHLEMATLYQQSAAEYRALCYQAFNIAKVQLVQASKSMGMRKQAVIVDIDETMLDNSPYEAKCILDYISYPDGWEDWMNVASAEAVPGALEFVKYAESKGVQVVYVTNRKEKYRKQTLKNLQELGFPYATNENLMLRTDASSKKERRSKVAEKFMIVMLIGDNLNDFSEIFEKVSVEERFTITDRMKDKFGTRFIVLPNAMYGEWEGAICNYDFKKSQKELSEIRKASLRSF